MRTKEELLDKLNENTVELVSTDAEEKAASVRANLAGSPEALSDFVDAGKRVDEVLAERDRILEELGSAHTPQQ